MACLLGTRCCTDIPGTALQGEGGGVPLFFLTRKLIKSLKGSQPSKPPWSTGPSKRQEPPPCGVPSSPGAVRIPPPALRPALVPTVMLAVPYACSGTLPRGFPPSSGSISEGPPGLRRRSFFSSWHFRCPALQSHDDTFYSKMPTPRYRRPEHKSA